jgi:ERF superfamily
MALPANVTPAQTMLLTIDYGGAIQKLLDNPAFDVIKLEHFIKLQHDAQDRLANAEFNDALAAAQADMKSICANANNPMTRSKYATYHALNSEVRPIAAKYGFSVTFSTGECPDNARLRVLGTLARGMVTRAFQVDIPTTTTGAKGQQYQTPQHGTISALTYGKKELLKAMFNLDVDSETDDDGNLGRVKRRGIAPDAGGGSDQTPPPPPAAPPPDLPEPPASARVEVVDAVTGEITTRVQPFAVSLIDADAGDLRRWARRLMATIRAHAKSAAEVDEFMALNRELADRMAAEMAQTYALFTGAVDEHKRTLTE